MAETYKPGQTVPQDGTVECLGHREVRDSVTAGARFTPCQRFNTEMYGKSCEWQYV